MIISFRSLSECSGPESVVFVAIGIAFKLNDWRGDSNFGLRVSNRGREDSIVPSIEF
jgi:hypothetical protein